jgi:hypothetical protein
VIVAVKRVLSARFAAGVNVATAPEQPIVPGTGVAPGPVTVKAVAGKAAQFIASLKVAVITWLTGTPVAVFTGTVAITAGGGVVVVNFQT